MSGVLIQGWKSSQIFRTAKTVSVPLPGDLVHCKQTLRKMCPGHYLKCYTHSLPDSLLLNHLH